MSQTTLDSLTAHIIKAAAHGNIVPVCEALSAQYSARGVNVTPVMGNCWFGEHMVACPHDGIPYCMDAHGRDEKIDEAVAARKLIIERHHSLVAEVYQYCAALDMGDIWVMCSGGHALTAYFGNKTGYLATLYLSHVDPDEEVDEEWLMEERELNPAAFDTTGAPLFLLRPSWGKHDHLFEGKFAIAGTYFETCRSVYGDEAHQ